MEVFNLFSGLVTQPGLSRAEKACTLQGLVPDLRITLPGTGGLGEADLLGIGWGNQEGDLWLGK